MSKKENSFSMYTLDKIPSFLSAQAPLLVGYCESQFGYGWEEKPSQLFEKFEELTRRTQLGLVGWVYEAAQLIIEQHPEPDGFNFIMAYFNLTTIRCLERTIENETQKYSDIEGCLAIEESCRWLRKERR